MVDPGTVGGGGAPRAARTPLVLSLLAVVMAAGALALAGVLWWQSRTPAVNHTDAQRAAAEATACAAYLTVRTGVTTNTNLAAPGGAADVTGALAAAANARGALLDGGQYLLARIGPATPADLADPLRRIAEILLDVGAAATAGAPDGDPAQTARIGELTALDTTLRPRCPTS